MSHSSTVEGDSSDDTSSFGGPYLSIMLPVFILVWYRYSKQYCRAFGKDGCSNRDFETTEDDWYAQFQSSDTADDYSPMVLTDRFVKWINRQNVFSGCEGYQSGIRGSTTGAVDNNDPSMNNATDCFREDFGMDGDSGLFWECIPDTQQQSSIELSSKNRSMQNNDSNTTSASGAPITTSNSEATQNSIAIGGSSSSQ